MTEPASFIKHLSKSPLQRLLINNFNKRLIDILRTTKSEKILDAGCGEGFVMVNLARNKVGKTYEGIDNSEGAIRRGKKMYPTLNIKIGDIYDLPYKDNSFDLVICTDVLQHLEDPKKALNELKRVTKKYIAISVPNEPFYILSNLLRGKYLKHFGNQPEHIQHWTIPGLKRFLRKNGVKISSVKTPLAWTLVLARK